MGDRQTDDEWGMDDEWRTDDERQQQTMNGGRQTMTTMNTPTNDEWGTMNSQVNKPQPRRTMTTTVPMNAGIVGIVTTCQGQDPAPSPPLLS